MVDEEAVGFVIGLAICTQVGADGLRLLSRVYEHQAFAAAGPLEDVSKTRVGILRRQIGPRGEFGCGWCVDADIIGRGKAAPRTVVDYVRLLRPCAV